jgi:hypothetical protein
VYAKLKLFLLKLELVWGKKKSLRDVQKPWDHCHGKGISKLMTLSIRRALAQLCQ